MADLWRTLDLTRDTVVEASAGTGKTYTIERLVGRLILEQGLTIDRILLVTFTEKATGEMKERVRTFLQQLASGEKEAAHPLSEAHRATLERELQRFDEAAIMTIHGFCQGVLTDFAFENGQVGNQELGDTDALQTSLLRQIMRQDWPHWAASMNMSVADMVRLEIDPKEKKSETPTTLFNTIQRLAKEWTPGKAVLQEAWTDARQCNRERPLLAPRTVARLHERLDEQKKRQAIFTYNDMIHRVAEAVAPRGTATRPLVHVLRNRYSAVLVDEFQDTDPDQWTIFKTIFHDSPSHRLIVVGDPKQAIYRFRGADLPTYIRARTEIGNQATLDTNFRSTAPLLDAFNACFGHPDWFGGEEGITYSPVHPGAAETLQLAPPRAFGEASLIAVDVTDGTTKRPPVAQRMAHFTAAEIAACLADPDRLKLQGPKQTPLTPNDFCILVRTRHDAVPFERALRARGIRYSFYKKCGIYQSDEALQLSTIVAMLANPADEVRCRKALISRFFTATAAEAATHNLAGDASFRAQLEQWLAYCHNHDWPKLFNALLYGTGLLFRDIRIPDGERRVANYLQICDELQDAAFNQGLDINGLAVLLGQRIQEMIEIDDETDRLRLETDQPAVRIMTMHVSKGLQFPVVFIGSTSKTSVASGQKVFSYTADGTRIVSLNPKAKTEVEAADLAEQKRLLYVAMTRAKLRVFLPAGSYTDHRGKSMAVDSLTSTILEQLAGEIPRHVTRTRWAGEEAGEGEHDAPDGIEASRRLTTDDQGGRTEVVAREVLFQTAPAEIRARKLHVDSFTRLAHHHVTAPAVDDLASRSHDKGDTLLADITDAEASVSVIPFRSLIPAGARGGLAFHDLMEALASDPELNGFSCATQLTSPAHALASPAFAAHLARSLDAHAIPAQPLPTSSETPSGFKSAHEELAAMALAALQHPLPTADGSILTLASLTPAMCKAEMEFHVTEAESLLGSDPLVPPERRGLLNGFIDLLFEHNKRIYILDWKTNTLDDYTGEAVKIAMEEADYMLQYRIYGLALMRWLETTGQDPNRFGGAYYLFVRGATRPEGIGVHADVWQPEKREAWQRFVSKRLQNPWRKESA